MSSMYPTATLGMPRLDVQVYPGEQKPHVLTYDGIDVPADPTVRIGTGDDVLTVVGEVDGLTVTFDLGDTTGLVGRPVVWRDGEDPLYAGQVVRWSGAAGSAQGGIRVRPDGESSIVFQPMAGPAATVEIGEVTQAPLGEAPSVTNVGTQHAAVLDVALPLASLDPGSIPVDATGGVASHVRVRELGVNPKTFGAVGDGVANDTAAIQAAVNATGTAGGDVFLPPGVFMNDGISLAGRSCGFRGVGPKTVLKARTGITGAVLDCTGWIGPGGEIGSAFIGNFNIEGDGVADATKTHYGINTSTVRGCEFANIGILNTGGPGWFSIWNWATTFRNITIGPPAGATTNSVPYAYFRGWMNGCRFIGIGFRRYTGTTDGPVIWKIEDDGTSLTHDSLFSGIWFEFQQLPEGGALMDFAVNSCIIETPQCFDLGGTTNAQTDSAHIRLRGPVNGASTNYGGNRIHGTIPGRTTQANRIAWGVDLLQTGNQVIGTKGFNGWNVRLNTGVDYTHVHLGGRVSGVSQIGWSDLSAATNNVLVDEHTHLRTSAAMHYRDGGGITWRDKAGANTTHVLNTYGTASSPGAILKAAVNNYPALRVDPHASHLGGAQVLQVRNAAGTADLFSVLANGQIPIANRTAVPTTPASGGVLSASGGALYWVGSSGTVTMIGPA